MEWVFGECKTFNKFKQRDIDRMQVISDNFPNSVLLESAEFSATFWRLLTCAHSRRATVR